MDDLINAFAGSQVTYQPNSTAAEHPKFSHSASYKAKSTKSSQEARRRKFLEAQKEKRYDFASHARRLATNEWDDNEDENSAANEMEVDEFAIKPPRSYKDQLMLSEWLVEVPSDLESLWYLVLCPVGKRCLVVASRGRTKVFTKSGYQVTSFQSHIPGGNKNGHSAYSLLDCVFNELDKTYYILDVMCWNSYPCFDSETEFRFYWKQSKIDECPEVTKISDTNPYKFLPLPYFNCDAKSIKEALWSPLPFASKLDGLLFYHKRTHYISATTPLVVWLKGYMVPEMLNIDIPTSLSEERPASYLTLQQHIPEVFAQHAKRKEEEEKNMLFED
ncbi:hypothetical protein JTE90_009973 [Oedothorax gibbosus]|uniref:Snurportin-1 n=1 Tax=Oedothorax gibbosus TaxID=931172 RepID=A0AAV6V8X1_9ARAC|nr:hypothetical protein JTE90_009973 [Oedothorax gibbosus]